LSWYTGDPTYDLVLAVALGSAAFVALASCFIPSPYGRFASERYGVGLDPRLGWLLMELPATLSFLYFYLRGPNRAELVPMIFCGMWLIHYANRGFFFPLSIRTPKGAKATFGLLVVVVGWLVTTTHGYLHAEFFARLGGHYSSEWLSGWRFWVGFVVYYVCFFLNVRADATLRNLRTREEVASGKRVYRIPRGGLFEYVTCPSYTAELVGWAGFALATWSFAGVFIFAISAANLVPRALATHAWYKERFPDYPKERRALVPFIL
jgi:3-oxo-5-alpha-steroid 4-dehydrogenase 1